MTGINRRGVLSLAVAALLAPVSARAQTRTTPVGGAELPAQGSGGAVDRSIVPELGRTVWNPGIYEGIPPDDANASTRADGVGPCAQHGSPISAGASPSTLQSALNAAGAAASKRSRRFVQLGAGTFTLDARLSIPSYVTLRGTMSGTTRRTIIRNTHDGLVLRISPGQAAGSWGTIVNVTGTVAKDAATITVADASSINVGDIIKIDTRNDGTQYGPSNGVAVYQPPSAGNFCWYKSSLWYQRQPYAEDRGVADLFPNSADGRRTISETHEVLAKNGNVLTIHDPNAAVIKGSPLRSPMYLTPQVYRSAGGFSDVVRYAGIEDLKIEPHGPGGRWVIEIDQAAFCWVKNVEVDGDATGTWLGRQCHVRSQTYRCEITGCYFHDSTNYAPGGNSYGIIVSGSEGYIHDNVCVRHTKPIVLECSCSGNVIAYNYVDAAIIGVSSSWHESSISTHAAFCHYELIEGNLTPNAGPDATHGNNGWLTMFRNHCTGKNSSGTQTAFLRCIDVQGWQREMYSIGNVLGRPGGDYTQLVQTTGYPDDDGPIYLIGFNAWPIGSDRGESSDLRDNGMSLANFHRHKDYDYFSNSQYDNSANPVKALPTSLHRATAPRYFDSYTWPWVDPAGASPAARVRTLPAKARYDAGQA